MGGAVRGHRVRPLPGREAAVEPEVTNVVRIAAVLDAPGRRDSHRVAWRRALDEARRVRRAAVRPGLHYTRLLQSFLNDLQPQSAGRGQACRFHVAMSSRPR